MKSATINEEVPSVFDSLKAQTKRPYELKDAVNQRKIAALDWIRRYGFSFPTIIDQIDGGKTKKLTEKIIRDSFVKKTKVFAPYQTEDAPKYFLTLTLNGLRLINQINDYFFDYKEIKRKIKLDEIPHSFITQNLTINALNAHKIKNFITEKEIGRSSEPNKKEPDCIWVIETGKKVGLEVELSRKNGNRLGHFVYGCLKAIKENELDYILIFGIKDNLLKTYQSAFEPGKIFHEYEMSGRDNYLKGREFQIDQFFAGRVVCVKY